MEKGKRVEGMARKEKGEVTSFKSLWGSQGPPLAVRRK